MISEFPKSWISMPLSDAVINITLTDKKIPQKEYLSKGVYPVFDQGQKYIGGYTDTEEKLVECELPVIVFGDHTRVIKFVNRPFVAGADGVKVLQPKRFYSPQLLEYFTLHIATYLTNHGYARHYQHLVKSTIPLPPINEQQRIVAKIEALFSELDNGIASLKTARDQLKIYRQALLKHAFSGKLTEQWRAENQDKLESAEVLLQRIQTEREQRYQQQLKDWEAKGKQGNKPKAPKILTPLTVEELAELPELPKKWDWFLMGDICLESILGKMLDKEKNKGELKPYLRNINVRWGKFTLDNLLEMRFEKSEHIRYGLKDGDLVICEGGEPGRCAVWRKEFGQNMQIQKALHRIRFTRSINSTFVQMYFELCASNSRLEKMFTGTTIKHLTGEKLARMMIPICSVDEQKQILLELESKFSEIDQLDQTLATALQQAEALRQSILKKAFSGQLVPQDPSDEPASVLLERIQAEKVKLNIQTPSSRGKKTVTKHRSPSC